MKVKVTDIKMQDVVNSQGYVPYEPGEDTGVYMKHIDNDERLILAVPFNTGLITDKAGRQGFYMLEPNSKYTTEISKEKMETVMGLEGITQCTRDVLISTMSNGNLKNCEEYTKWNQS